MADTAPRFQGFPDPTFGFFHALAASQDREWYQAHRAEFQRVWAEPMKSLLDDVRSRVAGAYKGVALKEPKLFRLHRDVRFSLDKSPFKTSLGAMVPLKGGGASAEPAAAFYLQVGTENFSGAGIYSFMGPALDRYRAAVLDGRKGAALARVTAELTERGYGLDAMETLKTAPRGVEKDHPRIELLKRKGLVATCPPLPTAMMATPAFADWCVDRALEMAPLVRWLAQNVA